MPRNDYNPSFNESMEVPNVPVYASSMPMIPQGYAVSPTVPADDPNNAAGSSGQQNAGSDYEPTIPGDFDKTVIVTDTGSAQSVKLVVGWLVCISGPCIGQDFRLKSGWNYIGRDATLDVYLKDETVSRQKCIKVNYDPLSRTFGVAPCDGPQATCYLNGRPLRGDRDFEAYDRLKVGECELMLIPFCSDKFVWEDAK